MVILKEKKAVKESSLVKNIDLNSFINALKKIPSTVTLFRGYSVVYSGFYGCYTLADYSISVCGDYSFLLGARQDHVEISFRNIAEVRVFTKSINIVMKNGFVIDLLFSTIKNLSYFS